MRFAFTASVLLPRVILLTMSSAALLAGTPLAHALVRVHIDLTNQRMHVEGDEGSYDWPISSARSGFYTPGGSFAPTHLELMHYSKKYHMSPMPHAIFFRGGYAIHGTYETGELGRPASHGCVRLSPGNAAMLYSMVKAEGARISISGTPPASLPFAVARRRSRATYAYQQQPDQTYGWTSDGSVQPGQRFQGGYDGQAGSYGYAYPSQGYYGSTDSLIPGF